MSECEHGPGCMCGRGSPILRTPRATRKPLMLTPEALAARDRENRAIGWDEGERHESEYLSTYGQFCPGGHCNPYRGENQ